MALSNRAIGDRFADYARAIRNHFMLVVEDEKTPTGAQERGLLFGGWRRNWYWLWSLP